MKGEGKGWHRESARHAQAARGIKTAAQPRQTGLATLGFLRREYAFNETRSALLNNLELFLKQNPRVKEIAIFGSFVTDKIAPEDIDVVILTGDEVIGERINGKGTGIRAETGVEIREATGRKAFEDIIDELAVDFARVRLHG